MGNNKRRGNKTVIGISTHCTSYNTSKRLRFQSFKLPPALWEALNNYQTKYFGTILQKNYVHLINNLKILENIPPQYYALLFKIFIYLEDYELQVIARRHNLMNQLLKEVSDKFVITVPTLDEDDPFVNIGDIVKLKAPKSGKKIYTRILDIEGKDLFVTLLYPEQKRDILDTGVNVNFCTSSWQMKCYHYTLHILHTHHVINSLYPKLNTNEYIAPQDDLNWIHKSVAENPEQKQVVLNIINNSSYPAPYVLFGPPGTGKTTTLVEAICQIRLKYKCKSILVCASSNAAVDEIAKRLLAVLPHKDVFRMYATSKRCEDVDKIIKPSSNFVDNAILFLPKELLILKKIVIATLVTCTRLVKLNLRPDHFSYIFIDEASQSIELESLIPFTLVSSPGKTEGKLNAQIVIAGDPYQLGPVVRCRKIEHLLGKSFLERLMECEPYQKVENKYNSRYITKLIRNYRSQEPIIHVSNELFYDNELLCCSETNMKVSLKWPILVNKTFPVIFLNVDGTEVRAPSASVYNDEEIGVVVRCTRKLLESKIGTRKVRQEDIGIVTPFKQQKLMIEKRLYNYGINKVTVGTVETFQGQEKEIIILTTVRSESFQHDGVKHIGFLSNPKRFNVAITRAKNLLMIVGNSSILCENECWKALWEYCKKNNACTTATAY